MARDLSAEAFEKILEMRNKIEDTLYMIVKEARFSQQPAVCFGHILLSLPIVTVGLYFFVDLLLISAYVMFLTRLIGLWIPHSITECYFVQHNIENNLDWLLASV